MKYIRNSKLLRITIVILIGYILFQTVLYLLLHKKAQTQKTSPDEEFPDDPLSSQSYQSIENFVTLCHHHGIPLILLDPDVFNEVIKITAPSAKKCHFFCNIQSVTVLGVFSQLWSHNEKFLQSLKEQGFTVSYSVEKDWDTLHYLSMLGQKPVYTHYLIERSSYIIHVVVLYERPGDYWWHGRLPADNDIFGDKRHIDRTNLVGAFIREGIYDSVELNKVTMDGLRLRAPRYLSSFLHQMVNSRFIHCNQSRADMYYSRYGTLAEDSQSFRDSAKQILSMAVKTLDHLGIPFWLSSGTCLGWYRQCDTIPYSGDVDIGMWIKDYKSEVIPSMQSVGLTLKHIFGKESDSFELSFSNGDLKLDIFFFYEESDYMWNGGTQTKTGDKFKYIFPKFSLCWTEFLELKVRVPCDTESYVKANYGDNWFVPVKSWDWKRSPPNVRPNGKWPEEEWDKVMVTF